MMNDREYQAARRALSQHLWRHHDNSYGQGDLEQRLEQHAEMHFFSKRMGIVISHTHAVAGEGETAEQEARRMLREGIEHEGNSTKSPGEASTLDSGEA